MGSSDPSGPPSRREPERASGGEPAAPRCELDADGARAQRERYRALGRAATEIAHDGGTLTARFSHDVDRELLSRTVAVERECCPLLGIELDLEHAALRMSVNQPSHVPVLASIAEALGVG